MSLVFMDISRGSMKRSLMKCKDYINYYDFHHVVGRLAHSAKTDDKVYI